MLRQAVLATFWPQQMAYYLDLKQVQRSIHCSGYDISSPLAGLWPYFNIKPSKIVQQCHGGEQQARGGLWEILFQEFFGLIGNCLVLGSLGQQQSVL